MLPGDAPDEVLLSTHVCHPSLCNDNLSAIAVATALARERGVTETPALWVEGRGVVGVPARAVQA